MAHNTTTCATADRLFDGRRALLATLDEAERYHACRPESKRRQVRPKSLRGNSGASSDSDASSTTSSEGSAAGLVNQFDLLREHVNRFWATDVGNPGDRYERGRQWLATLKLWDPTRTWKQVETAAPEQSPHFIMARQRAVLQSIPKGSLFV